MKAIIAVVALMGVALAIQTYRLDAAQTEIGTLVVSVQTARDNFSDAQAAAEKNLGAFRVCEKTLKETIGQRDLIAATAEAALTSARMIAQSAENTLSRLEAEREKAHGEDETYRAWSDARAPDGVFRRLRDAAGEAGRDGGRGRDDHGGEVDSGPGAADEAGPGA